MAFSSKILLLGVFSLFWGVGCGGSKNPLIVDVSSSTSAVSSSSVVSSSSSAVSSSSVQIIETHFPRLHINTLGGQEILTKTDYVSCILDLQGGNYPQVLDATAQIRQRGNSTRIYYDKKPYRIKLSAKASLLGMAEERDWVLLANHRDPTYFMNAVVFDMARYMELPYTNSNRWVELHINGEYQGLYQLTEQVEEGTNRVAVDKISGLLLSLDLDDGPELAPTALDNFSSTVFQLPICVKYPKDQSPAQLQAIAADFAQLETFIQNRDWDNLSSKLNVRSFIDFLIIQELTRNVELVSPRSMYLHRQADGVYHFGPVWDFDGGFAFNWASMTVGHEYFGSQSWLMGATNPSTHPRTAYNRISPFFVGLFALPQFVQAYRDRWNAVYPGMLEHVFGQLDQYAAQTQEAREANSLRWPIGKDSDVEIQRMKQWLQARADAYGPVVNGY
jgi:hypothetical protein